jgi:cytochrome oxidase Cu insertion factor (SCO1/SenC/PrrC family)
MPGMNSGLNTNDPVVIAAFRSALVHQGAIAVLIFLLLSLVWAGVRGWLPGQPGKAAVTAAGRATGWAREPAGRRLLRIGFGLLWVFDGLLQAQPAMAVGLPSQVIEPATGSSPAWVQHLVNWGGTTWSYHPIQAGAAAVWIQVGIGIWLLAAVEGPWSRVAGLVSVGWGLVVWVWGEAFGGIFAPGQTWLFGAPGAVLFYCAAGVLIALPMGYWRSPRLGRAVLAVMGAFFAGMAVLQAWPGRGFWQGISHGKPGTLAGMTSDMAQSPQPGVFAAGVRAFTAFDQSHGFAVNMFVVIALAVTGVALVAAPPRLLRPVIVFVAVLCLADWVLIEDFGFFGGLGTDPNSMIPMLLVVVGGYLALVRPLPVAADAEAAVPADATDAPADTTGASAPGSGARRERFRPAALRQMIATASVRSVVSAGAVGVIVLGAAPMAAAQASRTADPILALAIGGSNAPLDYPAPQFQLTDQHGRPVSLASLRGKVVLLTFLDPVCTTDCPLIAQEFRYAGQLLGAHQRQVELVAIALSPTYRSVAVVNAFDRQERLAGIPNWLFLTGTLAQLKQVWHAYGMTAYDLPAGAMTAHTDQAYVIDRAGHVRTELDTDPGPGTSATKASFASLLAGAAQKVLSSP